MTDDSAKPIKQADSDRPQPIDITTRLRQTRANMLGTDDEQHYWDCHEAAAEIERLRVELEKTREYRDLAEEDASLAHLVASQGLLLKCSEKAAIQFMLRHAAHAADETAFPDSADYRLHSEALYGLMERTAKWDTTKPRNGAVDTPDSQPTPGEGSTP